LTVSTPSISLSVLSGDLRTGSAQPLVLQCLASLSQYDDSGSYTFNFTWLDGGDALEPDIRRSIRSNSTGGYSILYILPPTTVDDEFTCMAQAAGVASNRSRPSNSGVQMIRVAVQGRLCYTNTLIYSVIVISL